MDLNDIKQLMQEFDASGIHKFSLEMDTVKLKLEKEQTVATAQQLLPAAALEALEMSPVAGGAANADRPAVDGVAVKSPVVGTFYSAGAPGADPFVEVGQRVKKGQTLCIVEAMKMMNEITAPVAGTVTEILVKEEDMVEFDQVIMVIKE